MFETIVTILVIVGALGVLARVSYISFYQDRD